jgi:WD40 repeat protein
MIIRQMKLRGTIAIGLMLNVAAAGTGMWDYQPPAKPEAEARASEQPRKQEEQSVRMDRYGDPLPEGALARLGTVRLRHSRISASVAMAPDGKHMATCGNDEAVRLWSLSTGKLIWSRQKMRCASVFSPNGKLVATHDKISVCLLDASTGRLIRRIPTQDYVHTFSPDGKFLVASSGDPIVRLWEVATGRCISEMKAQGMLGVAVVTADGRTLITGNHIPKIICHWDIAERKLRKTLKTDAPRSRSINLSPDGRTFAVVPAGREAVRLYDADTGKLRCQLQGDPAAGRYGLSFSADSRLLATNWAESFTDEVTISIWDASTGKPLRRFRVPQGHADSLCLAPDGRTLATMPRESSTLYLWDSVTGKLLHKRPAHTGPINALKFTPDGRQLASSDNKTLRLWETSSGRHLRELSRETWGIRDLAVTPDGRSVLSGGYQMTRLHDLATGEEQRRFLLDEHPQKIPKSPSALLGPSVQHLGLSENGRTAVCISMGLREFQPKDWRSTWGVHVWDFPSGRLLAHRDLGSTIQFIGLTPDARAAIESRIVSRNEVNSYHLVLHDLCTGRRLATLNLPDSNRCDTCALSPDGRTLVTAMAMVTQDKKGMTSTWGASTIRFWELASGKERQTISPPQKGWEFMFGKIALAPDGRILATVRNDRTIQLWDAVTGKELLQRSGFDSQVTALSFGPTSRSLATGHEDSTILIWDTGNPQISAERSPRGPDAKELDQWWSALAGEDAHAAWTTIWKMAAAPRHVLPLLRQRLKPAAAFPADEASHLIDDLDSSDFAKREAASKRLTDAGERVVPALENALKATASLEKRRRIKDLLPASEIVRSRDVLQAVRAIEVLERIGTAEAQQILNTLAQGMPEARATREAKASLERLRERRLEGNR